MLVALALIAGLIETAHSTAIIGGSRFTEPAVQDTENVTGLKAEYRRPKFIPFPKENPYSPGKAALGKKLFFDPRLSASSAQSCASCHSPGFNWGDGLRVGVGHGMSELKRRSPSILNAAWGVTYMWDGSASTLEAQTLTPIASKSEMNLPMDQLTTRLNALNEYISLFSANFQDRGITSETISEAIATYERTVVSGWTPFDSWIEGDENAISEKAKRGFVTFNTNGRCSSCHAGWNFTDDGFHDIGLATDDIGRGGVQPKVVKMQNAFKTPGLREVLQRAPYMHDGSLKTLEDVVEHYDHGGVERRSRSDLMAPLGLSTEDKENLVIFLKTLSSTPTLTAMPSLPR